MKPAPKVPTPAEVEKTRQRNRAPLIAKLTQDVINGLNTGIGYPVHVPTSGYSVDIINETVAAVVAQGWDVAWQPGEIKMVVTPS
jgi:hypothetical protein